MSIEVFCIKDFKLGSYPTIDRDEHDKETIQFQKEENIGKMWLLYDGYTYLTEFNNYLLYMKREREMSDSSIANAAQGFQKYLEFIQGKNEAQAAYEAQHPLAPKEPKMKWNEFPQSLSSRPTYAYKYFLEGLSKKGMLETSNNTTRLYMNAVVKFYKWRLLLGDKYANKPFEYVEYKVKSKSASSINEDWIKVNSTDVYLKLSADCDADKRRELYPMNSEEWPAVKHVMDNGYGIAYKYSDDGYTKESVRVAISKETNLAIKLARFSGLRRQEFVTFRLDCIKPLTAVQKKKLAAGHDEYIIGVRLAPKDGVETKNRTSRSIEIPCSLMQELREYINSERYLTRLEKFRQNHPDDPYQSPPVFISQLGSLYCSNTVNCDWGRVRNMVREKFPELDFNHKFHNLRSTYATERYLHVRELFSRTQGLEKGNEIALIYVGRCLGHKDYVTTIDYLKYATQVTHGNEVYEEYLSIANGDDEQTMLDELNTIRENL